MKKENSFTFHHRNIQKLAIEMYQLKHKTAPKLVCELLKEIEDSYNLQNDHTYGTYNENCTIWDRKNFFYGL